MSEEQTTRYIGFRHRVKVRTKDGEPAEMLPSEVTILKADGTLQKHELDDEQPELDFINGVFPIDYREPAPTEDVSAFKAWQILWRSVKDGDVTIERHESQKRFEKVKGQHVLTEVVKQVPCQWEGLRQGDVMAMCFGGSGNYFAYAAARKLHSLGSDLYRLTPSRLKAERGDNNKSNDSELLARLLAKDRAPFQTTRVRDLEMIKVTVYFDLRQKAMDTRIAYEHQLRQSTIGKIFCTSEGGFPEGNLQKQVEQVQLTDERLTALKRQESAAERAMASAVEETDIWKKFFADIQGVGPAIAARFITVIGDIRGFDTEHKLKAFLGVHVTPEGKFPRWRTGVAGKWSPEGRQALYLLTDQFNRNPGSFWGGKLVTQKERFREKHPCICIVDDAGVLHPLGTISHPVARKYSVPDGNGGKMMVSGKQRYTKGHIHKMARWRIASRFVEKMFAVWTRIEKEAAKAG